jgi:hypothetical protein
MKTIEELQAENDNLRKINELLESRFNNMQIWKDSTQRELDKTQYALSQVLSEIAKM